LIELNSAETSGSDQFLARNKKRTKTKTHPSNTSFLSGQVDNVQGDEDPL